MISIIKDYLNKISVHSESLSRTEKYINKPWVHIDSNGNYHKYIFNDYSDESGHPIPEQSGQLFC
jgi:hypothetical protein